MAAGCMIHSRAGELLPTEGYPGEKPALQQNDIHDGCLGIGEFLSYLSLSERTSAKLLLEIM